MPPTGTVPRAPVEATGALAPMLVRPVWTKVRDGVVEYCVPAGAIRSNFAELVVEETTEPLPVPARVTVLLASRVTVLVFASDGRTTEPNTMFWVLVRLVGDSTVTLAGAVAETLPAAK